jgi:HD-like signal output (HDOD) protein
MSLDRATIVTLGSALPPAIAIFGRLESLLQKTDTDLDQIVDLVRVDAALTFQIIRLGNSAFYGLKSRCDSLEEAVARIGFGDIHSLVGLVAARHACQHDLQAYQIPARRFWENSVATSQLMAAFGARNGTDVRNAYSTGLLRNLGRMVINDYAGAVRYPGVSIARDLPAWEMATYEISAAEVGAILLEHWRFSPDTVAAVRAHYNPAAATESVLPTTMLHLSAAVADGWGLGLPGEQRLWQQDAAMLNRAGLTEESAREAIADAQKNFTRIGGIQWASAA